ncbi:MAG: hypothetical protein ACREMU_09605 [Gemmatimonadaceae bacterium]
MLTPFVSGVVLALAAGVFAAATRLDNDRAFYPTLMIVIAFCYILFSTIGGTSSTIVVESVIAAAFCVMAILGFRRDLWLVVVALAAHGVFDLLHGFVVSNPGVPVWWPAFCSSYDLTASAFLAWTLRRRPGISAIGAAQTRRG